MAFADSFDDALKQGTLSPRFVVTIWVANGVSKIFSSGDTLVPDASPVITSVGSVSRSLDPVTRRSSQSEINVTMVRDVDVDSMIATYGLKNTRVEMQLGDAGLAAAQYEDYFVGIIDELSIDENTLSLRCMPNSTLLQRAQFSGAFINIHPLEAIEQVIVAAGMATNQYNAASLSWSSDSTTSHYVIDAGPPGYGENDTTIVDPVNSRDLVDKLGELLNGSLVELENGQLMFMEFSTSAVPVADWTENDILDLRIDKLYDELFNNIKINLGNAENAFLAARKAGKKIVYQHGDTDSQARYGYNESASTTAVASEHTVDCDFVVGSFYAPNGGFGNPGVGDTVTCIAHCSKGHAVCGMRWPNYKNGAPTQPALAKVSSSRLLYMQIGDEIVSFDLATINESYWHTLYYHSEDGSFPFWLVGLNVPERVDLRVKERGVFGTPTSNHGTLPTRITESLFDVTIPVAMAQARISRFANGLRQMRIKTTLNHYNVQLADLVTVTLGSRRYIAFGDAGIGTTTKWEVTGKEIDLYSDTPGIWFTVTFATKTGGPSVTDARSIRHAQMTRDSESNAGNIAEANAFRPAIVKGFAFTDNGLLSGTVSAGRATSIASHRVLYEDDTRDYTASKTTFVTFDTVSGRLIFREETLGASFPTDGFPSEAWVVTVHTDATDITSFEDTRTSSPIPESVVTPASMRSEAGTTDNDSMNEGGTVMGWEDNRGGTGVIP